MMDIELIGGVPDITSGMPEWTRDIVLDRLASGIRIIQKTVGRVGPREFGNSMPPFLVRLDNEFGVIAVEHHEIHLQVTSRQIRLADEACDWPAKYVSDSDTREALQIWMFAKAHRVPWQSLAVERGWARATAKRYKDRAIAEIVFGLMRDSIRVEESRR